MVDGRHLEKKYKLQYISSRLIDLDDLYVIWRVFVQICAFGGYVDIASYFRSQVPQKPHFGVWIGMFKPNTPYCQNCHIDVNQILHSDKVL